MSIRDQQNPFFGHLHLTGAPWDKPARHLFEDRVAAAAEAGATGIGFGAEELDQLVGTRSPAELRGILDHHGQHIGELEVLMGWHLDGPEAEGPRAVEKRMYALAGMFGTARIKASAVFVPATAMPPLDLLVERFAALCDRAAAHGVVISLEPLSVFPGFDYPTAAEVVQRADKANGGLLIDSWHFFRDPGAFAALDKLSGRHINAFELVDGAAEPKVSRLEDCVDHRLLPGEGDFDLARLVRLLDDKQVDVTLSVEVLSAELRALPLRENLSRTVTAVRTFLEALPLR
ncbi:TIM barrel protein [Streptomyces sp. NPDC048484]|uniref:sugar phosphate isomerase/epimerase family protein n=1 Tax=Streptomyces sp. NPDC048484 TaxID=3155146 RepID=UPI00341B236B